MKGKVKLAGIGVVFVVVAVSIAAFTTTSMAGTSLCGTTITSDFYMTDADSNELRDCPGDGLIIGASGTSSDPITIDGFGCTGGRCLIDGAPGNGGYGIYLNGKSNIEIKNLDIREFLNGIRSVSSSNIQIINNSIHQNTEGILLAGGNGVSVIDNRIEWNTDIGILTTAFPTSNYLIRSNTISSNYEGIDLDGTTNSIISFNSIDQHDGYGVYLWGTSTDNSILLNKILGNVIQANDYGTNTWDNNYPQGGNKWKLICVDNQRNGIDDPNGDGICDPPDAPENAPSNGQDSHPLAELNFITETTTLQSGFNLVSPELMPENGKLPDFLQSINGRYDVLFYYDSTTTPGKWKNYNVNKPPALNSLKEIKENMGFWIHITDGPAVTLNVDGASPINTRYSLNTGFNQISYPTNIQILASDAFANVGGTYSKVWAYDIGDPANLMDDEWKFYDGPTGATDTLTQMNPGFGYWVEVATPVTWDFLNNGEGKYYLA